MITVLKKTRAKNTFEQDTKTRDEGAGHITKPKLSANSLPVRRLPIRQAEVVCQFDLCEKYSHYL